MAKEAFKHSIYKKIIREKTGGGNQEDIIRRLLMNGSTQLEIDEIYGISDYEVTERLIEKNETDIREVYRIVKEYISRQKDVYDLYNEDVVDMILCPTYGLTRDEILFLADTEPFQSFN